MRVQFFLSPAVNAFQSALSKEIRTHTITYRNPLAVMCKKYRKVYTM